MTEKIKLLDVVDVLEAEALRPTPREHIIDNARANATKEAVRTVGGFQFFDEAFIEDSVEKFTKARVAAVEQFRTKRDAFKEELACHDLVPLAIVSTKHWDRIANEHGLITLNPTKTGNVGITNQVSFRTGQSVDAFFTTVFNTASMLLSFALIVSVIYGLICAPVQDHLGHAIYYGAMVNPFFYLALAGLATALPAIAWMKYRSINKKLRGWIASHSYGDLLRALIIPVDNNGWGTNAKLRLPDPPANIVPILRKIEQSGLAFYITAEPDAITLTPSAHDLFVRGYAVEAAHQEELERARRRDPIICVRKNGLTAVLAQFGDFEFERAAVAAAAWDNPVSTDD